MKSTIALVSLAVFFAGCTMNPSLSDYIETTKRGVETVPHVQEIRAIFTNAPISHFIRQHGLQMGKTNKAPHWNTVVWFGERYEIRYQVQVEPDYQAHKIDKAYGAKFSLLEVAKITHNGRGAEFEPSGQRVFDVAEWNNIVAAKGDFSVIGFRLKTNSPVPGFETYVNASRENRWAVKEW